MAAEVVNLARYRLLRAAARGQEVLAGRLDLDLTPELRAAEIPDAVLARLIGFDQKLLDFIQKLAVRVLDLGRRFDDLGSPEKLQAINSQLALLDQLRLESLRRLGWVSGYPGQELPLLRVILEPQLLAKVGPELELDRRHPDYPEFRLRQPVDGETVVRRLIPSGVQLFVSRAGRARPDTPPPAP